MSALYVNNITPVIQSDTDTPRSEIEDEIEQHFKAIITLKRLLNAKVAISRLPSELLAEIFVCLARDPHSRPEMARGAYISAIYGTSLQWIRTSQVCHAWREVALTTPRLWSFISVTRRDALEAFLARSKQAPLSVCIDNLSFYESCKVLGELLPPELYRLRELRFSGPVRIVHDICANLTQPAHLLHTLRLVIPDTEYSSPSGPSLLQDDLFCGQVPRLRILEIRQITINWDHPIFSKTLTSLVVIRGSHGGDFDQLLSALEQMTCLENLTLDDAIPPAPSHTTSLPAPSRTVALPSLRHIRLKGFAVDSANLLRHLSPAIDPELDIVTSPGQAVVQDLVDTLKSQLTQMKPLRTVRLAQAYGPKLALYAWRKDINFTKSDSDRYLSDFDLGIPLRLELSSPTLSEGTQRLFSDSSLWRSVRYLQVETDFDQSWVWRDIISGMPGLRVLGVLYGVEKSLLDALSAVHPAEKSRAPSVVLPHLEVLSFSDTRLANLSEYMVEERFFDGLIDSLILRCNYGTPVQEVRLTDCRNITVEDVARLREIVPQVAWDGVVEMEESEDDEDEDDDYDDTEEDYDDPEYDEDYGLDWDDGWY
ncbi:hypothetical protein BD311DRAFT_787152 [Dichomitus squalens]|uniref:F-box domain-containing protein n=1 Tax=Dichomitus squalens TaxID=114155 RepID=A0A4Q9MVN5_9APHY|nr:hypothetical protein BD311DRAFT_787152 [Dichomitus squalens]